MKSPIALFDDIKNIRTNNFHKFSDENMQTDYEKTKSFLIAYNGAQGTFNSYRRDAERFLHWTWLIAKKRLSDIHQTDIESFIEFCQKPHRSWIGIKKTPRFIGAPENRSPNLSWRPYVATTSKAARKRGIRPDITNFELSVASLKETFAVLGTFFNYLLQEKYVFINPVILVRQKSKYIRKEQGLPRIRRLSDLQWNYIMNIAENLANSNPKSHERTLFVLSALYSLYLRISELASTDRWDPIMSHFFRDNDENWWFVTVGKGNKKRQIAVSDEMLLALKRWRRFLNLSPLPSPADNSPLLPKKKGNGPICSINYIRRIVQHCFNLAIEQLKKDGLIYEADSLSEATVHWLRHTGISDDIKIRPREHIRDDAGHSSCAITDRYYLHIHLNERHNSAKNKKMYKRNKQDAFSNVALCS